jgi:hypothetical protein
MWCPTPVLAIGISVIPHYIYGDLPPATRRDQTDMSMLFQTKDIAYCRYRHTRNSLPLSNIPTSSSSLLCGTPMRGIVPSLIVLIWWCEAERREYKPYQQTFRTQRVRNPPTNKPFYTQSSIQIRTFISLRGHFFPLEIQWNFIKKFHFTYFHFTSPVERRMSRFISFHFISFGRWGGFISFHFIPFGSWNEYYWVLMK